jgi:hypothetical protein
MGRQVWSLLTLGAFLVAGGGGCNKGGGDKVTEPGERGPSPKVSDQKPSKQPQQKEAD